MGAEEGEVITHPLVTRSIGRAQKRVEGNNFEARKRLLDYDDVMNQQREVIYDLRLFALEGGEDLKGEVWEMVRHTMEAAFEDYLPEDVLETGVDLPGLRQRMLLDLHTVLPKVPNEDDPEELDREELLQVAEKAVRETFARKLESFREHREKVMSFVMLSTIDNKWKDHLYDLDHLKASIGFRGWGQKDPLVEYKKEAYEMFVGLMDDLRRSVTQQFFRIQVEQRPAMRLQGPQRLSYSGPSDVPMGTPGAPAPRRTATARGAGVDGMGVAAAAARSSTGVLEGGPDVAQLATNRGEKRQRGPAVAEKAPGRNDPCPCGSGKKYKKCHGAAG
ncbi:MAG: SEC-C metal-binding domain-containing protein [Gemmatimonadota bacterium]|nr:SEC-C metal-binding domain-containing protein [Gemmatimonadota bacterium]